MFGLIKRLLHELSIGDFVDKLTLDLAKPMVIKLARERLSKNGLTSSDKDILRELVKLGSASATELARKLAKSRQFISKTLVRLCDAKLLDVKREGRNRVYLPVLDVVIAYAGGARES